MRKSIISILAAMMTMALLLGIAFADPWETFKNTAYSRSDVVIGPGFDFTTSSDGVATFTNGLIVSSGKDVDIGGDINVTGNGTINGNWAVNGSVIDNGVIEDATYINDTLGVSGTTSLNVTTVTNASASGTLGVTGTTSLNVTTVTNGYASGTFGVAGVSSLNATTVTTLVASGDTYLNSTTVSTGDTMAVTDADGLTVGGVIVPQSVPVSIYIGSSPVDGTIWTAPYACQILSIKEAHSVAQNTAFPNTGSVSLYKAADGENSGAGTILHNTTMYLNSTVDTVVTPTLNAATGATTLAAGERIVANFNGTVTTLAGMGISIDIKRV